MRSTLLIALLTGASLALALAPAGRAEERDPPLPGAREGAFPGLDRQHEGRWKGPFFFIQLADTQFGIFNHDETWEQETALFPRAVEHINRLKPRFIIVC